LILLIAKPLVQSYCQSPVTIRQLPFAFCLSPFAFRLSPFAFRLNIIHPAGSALKKIDFLFLVM
jgi:hypothetical protein